MSRTYRRWADTERAELIRRWNAGQTAAQIATHFRRAITTIRAQVDYLRRAGHPIVFARQRHGSGTSPMVEESGTRWGA